MNEADNRHSVSQLLAQLNEKANTVYMFAVLYSDYLSEKQSYGTEFEVNMVEVHLLTYIDENPGITTTQLAKVFNRTKSAISQTASKLEEKGLLRRERHSENVKAISLFATEDGQRLSKAHRHHDASEVADTMCELMKTCTPEEVDHFFKVINSYIDLLKNDIEQKE